MFCELNLMIKQWPGETNGLFIFHKEGLENERYVNYYLELSPLRLERGETMDKVRIKYI